MENYAANRDAQTALELMDMIWFSPTLDITPHEVLILVNIAKNCNGDKSHIPASLGSVISQTRLANSTVNRVMRHLTRRGYLERTVEPTSHLAAQYLINQDKFFI